MTVPAGKGSVAVRVSTAAGTSAQSSAGKFSYLTPPAVSRVTPSQGKPAGGITVTVTGSRFAADDQVRFGSAPALSVAVVSPSKILATAPRGSGLVDIRVTTSGGASAKVKADRFGYLAKPAITSPSSATASRGKEFRFTVTTTGYPLAKITKSGPLPPGLKFTSKPNGTATITGTPTRKGRYRLIITARNNLGTARQTLTIRVS